MNKSLKRILPILIGLVIIASIIWYLFVYDRAFTRDLLLEQARFFESRDNHKLASWFYDQAYRHSDDNAAVAIELAEQFKKNGNYTQAEVTLSKAIADGGSVELYIALCKTFVEQDKLISAVEMLDNITDPVIREQIAALRPAQPEADLAPGYYSQYMTVNLHSEGASIYLSADGDYPSTTSDASDGSFTLVGGENVLYAIAVNEQGLVSPLAIYGYTVSGVIEEVTIKDDSIDAAVRDVLGFSAADTLYSSDLWTITVLELPEGAADYKELSCMPYLQSLTIHGSTAEDLKGLASLNNLTELVITESSLRTTDLLIIASLPNLQKLTLRSCGISGIDNLSGAHSLQHLDLSDNSIRDFTALSFLSGLTYLDLSHNALTSLNAISSLSNLQTLDVSYNSLSSVTPVAGCTQLRSLNISNNAVSSLIGVGGLVSLSSLDASFNALTEVSPLSTCTALTELNLSNNNLIDISCLSPLSALQSFHFSHNQIAALPNWTADSQLVIIDGSYNALTTLSTLAGFENLNTVLMDYNNITAVNTLASCPNLIKVSVFGNPVEDVSALTDQSIIVNYNPLT